MKERQDGGCQLLALGTYIGLPRLLSPQVFGRGRHRWSLCRFHAYFVNQELGTTARKVRSSVLPMGLVQCA
jgi:hypothetical protein